VTSSVTMGLSTRASTIDGPSIDTALLSTLCNCSGLVDCLRADCVHQLGASAGQTKGRFVSIGRILRDADGGVFAREGVGCEGDSRRRLHGQTAWAARGTRKSADGLSKHAGFRRRWQAHRATDLELLCRATESEGVPRRPWLRGINPSQQADVH
jgi:hypothetical protein